MELWVQHNDVLFQPIELGSAIGGQSCFRDLQGSVELQKLYAISTQSVPTAQRVNGRTDPCKSEVGYRFGMCPHYLRSRAPEPSL